MKKVFLLVVCSFCFSTINAQKKPYVIYNAKGKKVSYKKMLKTMEKKNMVLFVMYFLIVNFSLGQMEGYL